MTDRKIRYFIEVDAQTAANTVGQLNTEMDAFAKGAEDSASQAAAFQLQLANAYQFIGDFIEGITGAVEALIEFGDEFERQIGVLNRSTGSVENAQDAIGGLVSRLDLTIARSRLLQAGLRLTDEEFAAVAEVATDFAAATGGDAVAAMERLGQALISGSTRSLQQFGLRVEGVTDRSQRFEVALRDLQRRAGEMETGADSLGGRIQVLRASFDDLQTDAFEALDSVTGLRDAFDDLGSKVGVLRDAFREALGEELADSITRMFDLEDTVLRVAAAIQVLLGRFAELAGAAASFISATREGDLARAVVAFQQLNTRPFDVVGLVSDYQAALAQARAGSPDRATQPGAAGADRTRTGGHGAGETPEDRRLEAEQELHEQLLELEERFADEKRELLLREQRDADRVLRLRAEREEELHRERLERIDAEADKFREAMEGEREIRERAFQEQKRLEDDALEKRVTNQQTFVDFASSASRSLVKTFASIASGSADAGDAFKGLLADFLAFISEKAILKAADEYAEAAGAFARYDYGGGAAHIAAGVAFTGVAIAAGAGAAALSAPSAPAQAQTSSASRPRPEAGSATGGNVTYIFNQNGPTLTAQGDALLGRRLGGITARGAARFGMTGGRAA